MESKNSVQFKPNMSMDFLPEFDLDEPEIIEEDEQVDLPENADPNVVAAFEYYRDNNFFSVSTDDFDGTPEGLQTLLTNQWQHSQQSLINNAPDFAKPLIELVQLKGSNFTEDELVEALNIIKPPTLDLKDEAQAESYLRTSYAKEGMTEEEIEEEIEELKYKDKLTKAAERALKVEQKLNKTSLVDKVEQAKVQQANEMKDAQEFVAKFQQTINELPWQAETKQAIQEEFQTGKFKQKLETIFQSPKDLADLVAFVQHYGSNGFNLTAYQKAAFSPTVKKVRDTYKNYWGNTAITSNKKQSNGQEFDFDF